jgi:hypothetical protein
MLQLIYLTVSGRKKFSGGGGGSVSSISLPVYTIHRVIKVKKKKNNLQYFECTYAAANSVSIPCNQRPIVSMRSAISNDKREDLTYPFSFL